jgi:amidophosphoribosyltransferase
MGRHDSGGHEPIQLELDHPRDECGVFGIFAPGEDVARNTYFGLFALQHRGQESAGIAVADGREIRCHKDMGLVSQVFDERDLSRLTGMAAIGHTRYSTTGSSVLCNAQPILVEGRSGPIAVAHNGNIVNTRELRTGLQATGAQFVTTNDSEVIARCIAHFDEGDVLQAIKCAMVWLQGAYSVVVLTPRQLFAFRDPNGVRPLCLATLDGSGIVVSSETCALNVIGARFLRELEPGEVVVADRTGLRELQAVPADRPAMCLFEFIYLARPDSHIYGRSLHEVRRRMGHELASEQPAHAANLVIPVPDTGFPAAIGFAQASNIPFGEGLIKSRYIGRTFIEPDQRLRELGVRMKLSALRENLAGRRVVMVDDSIVRGTTTGQIVRLLKEAGAAQVHVRISSPPIKWPCFYGIDMANRRELIAAKKSVSEIERDIGADSLGYLSLRGVLQSVGISRSKFCHACFSGEYPIPAPGETEVSKFVLEEPALV